ncbi:MAG: hypothetical protein ACOCWU_06980, partial [Spirochaetota bacterium]
LQHVFAEEFPQARIQRCHVQSLATSSRSCRGTANRKSPTAFATFFCAPDRVRARELYTQFYADHEREFPSALTSLKNSI